LRDCADDFVNNAGAIRLTPKAPFNWLVKKAGLKFLPFSRADCRPACLFRAYAQLCAFALSPSWLARHLSNSSISRLISAIPHAQYCVRSLLLAAEREACYAF
jgi:hypothetical protein